MLDGDGIYKISNFAIGTKVHIAITCPGPLEKQTIWINGKNCGYVTTDGTQLARIESIDCYVYHDQDPPVITHLGGGTGPPKDIVLFGVHTNQTPAKLSWR